VYEYGGTFTMEDGVISGNTASGDGGGVYVGSYGSFQIVNGIIYGSNETGKDDDGKDLKNTVTGSGDSGAALYKGSRGEAQHGTFTGPDGGWVSKGDLDTTDNTIEVEDGELVQ
jgi:predicted outer membrane repeat protein